jgi:Mg2+ and Co2+ transporter CorA
LASQSRSRSSDKSPPVLRSCTRISYTPVTMMSAQNTPKIPVSFLYIMTFWDNPANPQQASRKSSPSHPTSHERTSKKILNAWTRPKVHFTASTLTFTSRSMAQSSTPSWCARVRSWDAARRGSDRVVNILNLYIKQKKRVMKWRKCRGTYSSWIVTGEDRRIGGVEEWSGARVVVSIPI